MTNIFENAYFGKAYKTRDGRKAIYTIASCGSHWLVIQDTSFTWEYNDNGKLVSDIGNIMDIVSEWQEEIDEEKLNRLAEEYFLNTYNNGVKDPNLEIINEKEFAVADFKAGYREALKQ